MVTQFLRSSVKRDPLPVTIINCPEARQLSTMSNDSSPGGSQTSLNGPEAEEASSSEILALPNLRLLEINDQIRELQTIIRDK